MVLVGRLVSDPEVKTLEDIEEMKQDFENAKSDLKYFVEGVLEDNQFDDIEVVNSQIQDDVIDFGEYMYNIYDVYKSLNIEDAREVVKRLNKHITTETIIKPLEEKQNAYDYAFFFILFSYPKICDNSKNLLNKKEIKY